MNKPLKIVLSSVAVIVVLVVALIVVVPLVIDPNDYKPQIQNIVKEKTGRDLIIGGDFSISVFPWIGLSTGQLSLSNAPGFAEKVFADIEQADIRVKLLPLLSKKVEVSRIVLNGLNLNLAKNKQGMTNWQDLSAAQQNVQTDAKDQPSPAESGSGALAALAIGGVAIENAQIQWADQQKGSQLQIKDLNLSSEQLKLGETVPVTLGFTFVDQKQALTQQVQLNGDLWIDEGLQKFSLHKLALKSLTEGEKIPGGKLQAFLQAGIDVDLEAQTLAVKDVMLKSGDLLLNAQFEGSQIKQEGNYSGQITLAEFNLGKQLRLLGMKLNMQDSSALEQVSAQLSINATPKQLNVPNLLLKVDDSVVKGHVMLNNLKKPAIKLAMELDQINLDRYLPEKTQAKSTKTAATPAAAAAAGAALLPVEMLRNLNVDGALNIKSLKVNNIDVKGINLKLEAKNGQVKTRQSIKNLYQGSYSGSSAINVRGKTPVIDLHENLKNVQMEPLLKNWQTEDVKLTGQINASAKLNTRGNSTKAIKSALNGKINFRMKDGVVKGVNIQKIIDNTKSLIEGTSLPTENKNDETLFSEIKGTAIIRQGVLRNDDLQALSSRVRVEGAGMVDLAREKLDYTINGKLREKATADQPEKIKGVPLIVNIGGTFKQPSYTVDVAAMLLEKNREKINKKADEVLQKLDEKLGPGVGDLIKGLF